MGAMTFFSKKALEMAFSVRKRGMATTFFSKIYDGLGLFSLKKMGGQDFFLRKNMTGQDFFS